MYTLSFKCHKIYAFYNLDTPSGEAGQKQRDAIASIPELKNLSGKISESELYNRARVISKLKEFSKDPRKTFGTTKSTLNSVGVENALNNMKELITALSNTQNIQELGNKEIVAWFKGWDGIDDTNIAVVSGTRMTYRKFLANVINDSELVANLFARPSESREKTEEKEIIEQRTRLGTFLVALESRNADNEYKTMFRQAHQALIEKNLTKAKDILRKTLKSEWNIDMESVITEQGKIAALRAIGATYEAAQSTVKQAANLKDKPRDTLSSKEKDLIDAIHNNLDTEKKKNIHLAGDIYGSMLRSIPETDPYRKQVERSRESMIEEIASEKAYISILDGYIKKNGSEGLGSMLEAYDEMRGLYGPLNFTDENAKMTKEVAIMLASFVLTAGVGPALGALGAGARILTAGKTINVASKTGTFARNVARARNVATSTVAKSGSLLQGASTLDKTMSASRLGKIGWEATKFTTADSFIRTLSREAGEKSGFDSSFGEKLAKNAAMFGLFSGMEKFVSGPLKTRAIEALGIKSGITQFTVGTTILTTGDVAAMWILGMAESGNLHVPEAMEIYQALAFRIGMKGTEKLLPKLSEKFAELKSKRQGTTEVGGMNAQTPKTSIERNTKYYEQADKFVISKSNKSDIRRFQKEGFDLAEIGFDGWNVRQAQKKGEVSYILTKNGVPGEHTFTTLEALQRFLTTNKSVFQGASGKPTQTPSMRDPDMAYGAKLETESPYTLNIGKAPVQKAPESVAGKVKQQPTTKTDSQNQEGASTRSKNQEVKNEPLIQITYSPQGGKVVNKWEGKSGKHTETGVMNDDVSSTNPKTSTQNTTENHTTKRNQEFGYKDISPSKVTETANVGEAEINSFFKSRRIKNWSEFEANFEELKKQERILRLKKMREEPGNTRHAQDYSVTITELNKYKEVLGIRKNIRTAQGEIQKQQESHPTVQSFFKSRRIKNWSEFEANFEELKKQERILRLKKMREESGNTRHAQDYSVTITELNKYKEVLGIVPTRINNEFHLSNSPIQTNNGNKEIKSSPETPTANPKTQEKQIENKDGAAVTMKSTKQTGVASKDTPNQLIPSERRLEYKKIGYTNGDIIPIGKQGDRIIIDGKEYRWSDKQDGWVGKSENGVHTLVKPTEQGGTSHKNKPPSPGKEVIPPERQLEYKKTIENAENGLTTGIEAVAKDPSKLPRFIEHLKKNWGKYATLGIVSAILGYLYLSYKKNHPNQNIPAPQAGDTANQDAAVSYCENFSNNPKSKLNLERQSDAGEGIILTEKRRENISRRWMRTQEWKELETAITQNAQVAKRLSDEFHNIFSEVQENPSVLNVQELQRITGMNAEDAKTGQDGILGPRTTKRIRDYIISCMNPKAVQNNEPSSEVKPITQVSNTGKEEILYDEGEWEDIDE